MERKLYYQILKFTKIPIFAKAASHIISAFVTYICLFLVRIGIWKKPSTMTSEHAREILESYSPKPKSQGVLEKNEEHRENHICHCQLSIIVPAYNAAQTIVRCLNSVLSQKTQIRYELIVVNDGSTDETLELLDHYKRNRELTIISQKNMGFSGARNTGINSARGEYIAFLDSDDEMGPQAIEKLMEPALKENAYIVAGSFETVYNHKSVKTELQDGETCKKEQGTNVKKLSGFAWGKVFKRELFSQVRFPEGYLFEDTIMAFLIHRLAQRYPVKTVSDVVYRYYKNDKGITATYRKMRKCADGYWIVEKMLEETRRLGLPMDEQTFQLVYGHLVLAYWRTRFLSKELREAVFILSCGLMDQVLPFHDQSTDTAFDRQLISAYEQRKFALWNVICAIK